jgi:hypothetical protein
MSRQDFGNGERDHAWVGWRRLLGMHRHGRLGAGPVLEVRGGDGADRQGGHDQDGVPQDRMVEADLRLIEAEPVLAELEVLFPPAT